MQKKGTIILAAAIAACATVLAIATYIFYFHKKDSYKSEQNIYFWEYENNYDTSDTDKNTIIYKYDPLTDETVEIGRIQGYFNSCVINREETCITGLLCETSISADYQIFQFDLESGNFEKIEATNKINELVMGSKWENSLLYDNGHKIFISYFDEKGDEYWLLYDLVSGDYEELKAVAKEAISTDYVMLYDNVLWYQEVSDDFVFTLYQYDLGSRTKTKVDDDVFAIAVAPEAGLRAYINDFPLNKIYLYDTNSNKESVVADGSIYRYNSLYFSDTGENTDDLQLYYIGYNDNGAIHDVSLIVYDIKTGEKDRIYKVKDTSHLFEYIPFR